jgi:hypothetical protein
LRPYLASRKNPEKRPENRRGPLAMGDGGRKVGGIVPGGKRKRFVKNKIFSRGGPFRGKKFRFPRFFWVGGSGSGERKRKGPRVRQHREKIFFRPNAGFFLFRASVFVKKFELFLCGRRYPSAHFVVRTFLKKIFFAIL